jgi:hypothetical protein
MRSAPWSWQLVTFVGGSHLTCCMCYVTTPGYVCLDNLPPVSARHFHRLSLPKSRSQDGSHMSEECRTSNGRIYQSEAIGQWTEGNAIEGLQDQGRRVELQDLHLEWQGPNHAPHRTVSLRDQVSGLAVAKSDRSALNVEHCSADPLAQGNSRWAPGSDINTCWSR